MGCCQKNKGWQIESTQVYRDRSSTFEAVGKYNIQIQNTGDVDAFVDGVIKICPGECRNIGVPDVPCARQINLTFSEDASQTGTAVVVVVAYNLIKYDCGCDDDKN
jgi:hypothetical protein